MSEVAPPSPTPPPAGQAPLPRLAVTLTQAQLTELPLGAKLDVIVASISEAAELKVSSRLGEITVKLPTISAQPSLKTGDALILQLLSKGAAPKVALALPDGKPLSIPTPLATQVPGQTATAGATPVSAPAGVNVAPGAIITTTLLRPVSVDGALILQQGQGSGVATGTTQPTATGPGLSGAQSGTQASTQFTGTSVPTSAASGAPVTASGGAAPVGTVTTLPAGSSIEVRIVAVNVPSGPPQSFALPPLQGQISLAPGAQLSGMVSGTHGVGQTLVQTHAGPVSLPTTQPLPLGAEVRLELIQMQQPSTGSAQHGPLHTTAAPLLEGEWFAFEDALSTLREAAPGAHQHILQAALPRADTQLATNVLFFLSALRGGDIKNWLGDGPMRVLDRLRPDLANRLRTDMTQMTRNVEDPLSGDWRLHGVPFLYGEQLDRVQLLIRDRDAENGDDDDGRGGTRFVVDLNLSKLGHLQIDGLVGENDKRLDLILRTDEPLPSHMRDDIRRLFHDAMDLTGLEGSVGFKAAPGEFVNIPKRAPGAAGDVVA